MPRQYARVHLGASGGMELDGMALHQVANPQCKRIAEVFRFTRPGKVSACLKCLHKGAAYHLCSSFWFDNSDNCNVCTKPQSAIDAKPRRLSPVLGPKRLQYFVANILVTWRNTERPDMIQHDTVWHMAASKSLSASVSAPGPKGLPAQGQLQQKGIELKLEHMPPIATILSQLQ